MKIQTGIDIIEVKRIEEAIEKQGERFLKTIYTPKEIEYCEKTNKMKYQHYAARFAAKEAIYKAISFAIAEKEDNILTKIEIVNEKSGKPIANIEKLKIQNIETMDLSISHLQDYAVASFVILLK
jgi:holo-[acyl-carrier protein] synthase